MLHKRGVTLIELIVALAIVMILVGIIGSTMVRVIAVQTRISQEQELIANTNDFIAYFTFLVRLGVVDLDQSKDNRIVILQHPLAASANGGPLTLRYYADNSSPTIPQSLNILNSTNSPLVHHPDLFINNLNFNLSPTSTTELQPLLHYRMDVGLRSNPDLVVHLESSISLRQLYDQ